MNQTTREERQWLLRNFAIGLVNHLGAVYPPVWVENLLKHPPPIYTSLFGKVRSSNGEWSRIYARPAYLTGTPTRPWELPIDERRFAIARDAPARTGGVTRLSYNSSPNSLPFRRTFLM